MRDHKLVITTEPKTFNFDLSKDVYINFKHVIYSNIKKQVLSEHITKSEVRKLFPKYKRGNYVHNFEKQQNK